MPRRKQERPKHLENPEELASSLQNVLENEQPCIFSRPDGKLCVPSNSHCSLETLLLCMNLRLFRSIGFGSGSGSETEGDEHVCGKCRAEFPTLSDFLQHKKSCVSKRPVLVAPMDSSMDTDDEEEDNDSSECDPVASLLEAADVPTPLLQEWLQENRPGLQSMIMHPHGPSSNVTLSELENTSVAVAQFGWNGNNQFVNQIVSMVRQGQFQQIQLLKLIARMIAKDPAANFPPMIGTAALTPQHHVSSIQGGVPASGPVAAACATAAYPQGGKTEESPQPAEDNLALLQKHTERYLQESAPRKSLFNGMDDENRSKRNKDLDPALRHKCHFCGKLLGSDSALQIHLRSHTGEKPFQCEMCGSAFTTRGNLKVHAQRHRAEAASENKQMDGHNSFELNGKSENPPILYPSTSDDRDLPKSEQALDFSRTVNGQKSPQGEIPSRSVSPNDTSNFSDGSLDGSSDENLQEDNYSNLKIDVERYEDEDRDNSNGLDDEESEMATSHQPSFGGSPNFAPYFLPYEQYPSTSQMVPGNGALAGSASNNPGTNNENPDNILQDPNYYQDLLPRIGSNDNSWESLIEVTKTSETSKLQQLVDNIENKLIEPNQCIICHRVLSCKSALQMHYRTHTGERPYRCKLCSRAFTTKGNLKTHMGVHRTKPPTRLLHQCPVCHRQFPNSLVLQQHVRTHTTDHVLQLPPIFNHCDDRPPPTLLPPSYPKQFLAQSLVNAEPLALTSSKSEEDRKKSSLPSGESVIKTTGVEPSLSQAANGSPAASPKSVCSPPSNSEENSAGKESKSTAVLDYSQSASSSPIKSDLNIHESSLKIDEGSLTLEKDRTGESCTEMEAKSDAKSAPNLNVSCSSPIQSPKQEEIKSFSSHTNSLMVTLASDRPLPMTLPSDQPISFSVHGSDRHYPPISLPTSGATYTESLTALENHVKGINSSVTHPLPFTPHFGLSLNMANYFRDYNYPQKPSSSPTANKNGSDAEDRSTPGGVVPNGKGESPRSNTIPNQLTPKMDGSNGVGALDLTPRSSPAFQRPNATDMKLLQPFSGLPFAPPHHRLSTTCRVCFKTFACNSALEIHYRSHTKERPFRCEVCDRGFSTKGNMRQHMLTHKIRDFPPQAFSTNSNSCSSPSSTQKVDSSSGDKAPPVVPKKPPAEAPKRPLEDTALPPPPKRAPGQPKHMCQVCHKPFSSGSALQIHMRTHTGDKPFQCTICHRAFTTKGNLKVHMGTHMWNNSTSRRGRRMSLEINQFPPQPGVKPGEFGPPAYFPYLSPFMNGMPPPPKMNEISVIQTAGMGNGAICSAPSVTTSAMPTTPQQPLALLSSSSKQTDREEGHQNQNSHSQGKDIHLPASGQEVAASWPWKISCNVCNKICSSSTELELHLRNNHSKKETSETDRTD